MVQVLDLDAAEHLLDVLVRLAQLLDAHDALEDGVRLGVAGGLDGPRAALRSGA